MKERVLVTGGAGFIGSRLVKALVERGADVLIFDNLHPQVHGSIPSVNLVAPLIRDDIRDGAAVERVVRTFQPEVVVHLAAETGTGQSADEPVRYCEVNVGGTALLVEALRRSPSPPRRIVLASTRAVYGEGAYRNGSGELVVPNLRRAEDMAACRFDVLGANSQTLEPLATPEWAPVSPGSVYGSTKLMQEHLVKQVAAPWDWVILRLQNVYGPGQSLLNPYTGVLSIFCQQAMEGKVLNVFEDGRIYRDFVFVDDVVQAFVDACWSDPAVGLTMNIGTGQRGSILDVARMILSELGLPPDRVRVTGDFRKGDVRHAVADISLVREVLGWKPTVSLRKGVAALVAWAR